MEISYFLKDNIDLIYALIYFTEAIIIIFFGYVEMRQISRRTKNLISVDSRMLNTARIFSWGSIIAMKPIEERLNNEFYVVIIYIILLIIFIFGERLYLLSFKSKKKDKKSFWGKWDKEIKEIYIKYLEPLWRII
jgi:uncharacterized sodium:solute symporter family permease YidK